MRISIYPKGNEGLGAATSTDATERPTTASNASRRPRSREADTSIQPVRQNLSKLQPNWSCVDFANIVRKCMMPSTKDAREHTKHQQLESASDESNDRLIHSRDMYRGGVSALATNFFLSVRCKQQPRVKLFRQTNMPGDLCALAPTVLCLLSSYFFPNLNPSSNPPKKLSSASPHYFSPS